MYLLIISCLYVTIICTLLSRIQLTTIRFFHHEVTDRELSFAHKMCLRTLIDMHLNQLRFDPIDLFIPDGLLYPCIFKIVINID